MLGNIAMFFIIALPEKLVKFLKFFYVPLDKTVIRMYNNFSAPRVQIVPPEDPPRLILDKELFKNIPLNIS